LELALLLELILVLASQQELQLALLLQVAILRGD
jgi:hypothetical protein